MMKVIDVFAGPGGLGEGFSRVMDSRGDAFFTITLSIEMDKHASTTLRLRTFLRKFGYGNFPNEYYLLLQDGKPIDHLFSIHPSEARLSAEQCWRARLGPGGVPADDVRNRIDEALGGDEPFVLIGGPPCQAYSLAGRSRNRGNKHYIPEEDVRQRLYVEYLQILADHAPVAFVMENVKGLLSAAYEHGRIFNRILDDLRQPADALREHGRAAYGSPRYRLHSLVMPGELDLIGPRAAVVRSEEYGVPQARHRVILLGIHEDLLQNQPGLLVERDQVSLAHVLDSLPALRSGVSRESDSPVLWDSVLRSQESHSWFKEGNDRADGRMSSNLRALRPTKYDRGDEFIERGLVRFGNWKWYHDPKVGGVLNHTTRSHMRSDLYRYFFAACFAEAHGRSPFLADFPVGLLPEHRSAAAAVMNGSSFADRFRVQTWNRPSTTVTSHISKDGHYYIHPDPLQCRSLTVREAARLQTFPDNYLFCGPRTAQYTQVGNAVPPFLAYQIAGIVKDLVTATSRSGNGQAEQRTQKLEHVSDPKPGHEAGTDRETMASSNGLPVQVTSKGSAR